MLKLLREDMLIYILGNHETLLYDCLLDIARFGLVQSHHYRNRTWDTLLQISGMSDEEAHRDMYSLVREVVNSEFYQLLLPSAINYFETKNYIFTHGWIPCANAMGSGDRVIGEYDPDWRNADSGSWKAARWYNGMRLACIYKVTEPKKTVVCGHWHASYGHTYFDYKGSEFGENADFSPFYHSGIIAIDGCTAASGRVNCIVLEDEEE